MKYKYTQAVGFAMEWAIYKSVSSDMPDMYFWVPIPETQAAYMLVCHLLHIKGE